METYNNKKTCVRIEIDEELHIDLPLYAIPDEEFTTLGKAAARTFGTSIVALNQNIADMLDREISLRIPHDRVMLAHRELKWIASDPRALHDWFLKKVDIHGSQLRRICRYLKGWRDFAFSKDGPESITLMVCAVNAFDELNQTLNENRDDEAFLYVVQKLPEYFRTNITNPALPDDDAILNQWNDIEQRKYINAAISLENNICTALNGTLNTSITVEKLIEALGIRFPSRPDLVAIDTVPTPAVISKPQVAAPLALTRQTTSG